MHIILIDVRNSFDYLFKNSYIDNNLCLGGIQFRE